MAEAEGSVADGDGGEGAELVEDLAAGGAPDPLLKQSLLVCPERL